MSIRLACWSSVMALSLVRPIVADEAARAEAQRLAEELRQAKDLAAKLVQDNTRLKAELKDEQLKNAIDVDQEIKRLKDLLRTSPEKEALVRELAKIKEDHATLAAQYANVTQQLQGQLKAEKDRADDQAVAAKKAQADVDRLGKELARKNAELKTYDERVGKVIEQVAVIKRELAEAQPQPKVEPKPQPKLDDGPTPEQLKRLTDGLRRRAEEAARLEAEKALEEAERARAAEQKARALAEQRENEEAERARAAEQKARAVAEQREKEAQVPKVVDPARMEAEIRAAKAEAQLQIISGAYAELRQENARLRAELDAEHKARVELTLRAVADPKLQQRVENLEAVVAKLSVIVEQMTMKKTETPKPQK